MKFYLVSIFALCLAATACAPDPLEGFGGDMGMTPNNGGGDMGGGSTTMTNGNPNNGTQIPTAEFSQVANILIPNCLAAGCHGAPGNGVFAVATGVQATPAELAAVLQSQTITADGSRLVAPGDPASSNIITRMNSTDPIKVMPTTGALPMTDIMTVQTWIQNGATYFQ